MCSESNHNDEMGKKGELIADFSTEEVVTFLEGMFSSLDAGVLKGFKDNGVNGAMLFELTKEDFVNTLGLTSLQARRVLNEIGKERLLPE